MSDQPPESRRCPYCGCGFTPTEPDQRYCSPFCEEQAKLEGRGLADD